MPGFIEEWTKFRQHIQQEPLPDPINIDDEHVCAMVKRKYCQGFSNVWSGIIGFSVYVFLTLAGTIEKVFKAFNLKLLRWTNTSPLRSCVILLSLAITISLLVVYGSSLLLIIIESLVFAGHALLTYLLPAGVDVICFLYPYLSTPVAMTLRFCFYAWWSVTCVVSIILVFYAQLSPAWQGRVDRTGVFLMWLWGRSPKQAPIVGQPNSNSEAPECKVCMSSAVTEIFLPCGHLVCCDACSWQVDDCPICRKRVEERKKAYF